MAYVEWLRVRGALKVTAIVLGVIFLIAVILRITVMGLTHDSLGYVMQMQRDPNSTVNETTLPDGSHRIVIDNHRDGTHIVVTDYGWRGKHVEITEPHSHSREHDEFSSGFGFHFRERASKHGDVTVIDTNDETRFANFVLMGAIAALILATCFGAPFARENEGHLEFALTKPIDRVSFGLRIIAIDAVGIVAGFWMTVVAMIACQALFELPFITFDGFDAIALGIALLGPLAWYAMLSAATASMKRSYGIILGFAWPVALAVVGLSLLPPQNVVLAFLHYLAWALSFIDPLTYLHVRSSGVGAHALHQVDWQQSMIKLAVLAVVYSAAALWQWRRIEA